MIFHDFSDFFRKIFEKSRKSRISLDFPLHLHGNVKENQAKSNFFEIFRDFRKFSEKIWKIMKNQKFSKSPKYFSLYFRVWSRFCGLEIPETKSSGGSRLVPILLKICTLSKDTRTNFKPLRNVLDISTNFHFCIYIFRKNPRKISKKHLALKSQVQKLWIYFQNTETLFEILQNKKFKMQTKIVFVNGAPKGSSAIFSIFQWILGRKTLSFAFPMRF